MTHNRQRLTPFLIDKLNNGLINGLSWVEKSRGSFRISWKHGGTQDWSPEHSQIFKEWARHTGKYREGVDSPEWAKWKTRIRCAFNKSPDIVEIKELSQMSRSDDPYKVYRFTGPLDLEFYKTRRPRDSLPQKPQQKPQEEKPPKAPLQRVWMCPYCSQVFINKDASLNHECPPPKLDPTLKTFICNKCDFQTPTETKLREHKEREHFEIGPYGSVNTVIEGKGPQGKVAQIVQLSTSDEKVVIGKDPKPKEQVGYPQVLDRKIQEVIDDPEKEVHPFLEIQTIMDGNEHKAFASNRPSIVRSLIESKNPQDKIGQPGIGRRSSVEGKDQQAFPVRKIIRIVPWQRVQTQEGGSRVRPVQHGRPENDDVIKLDKPVGKFTVKRTPEGIVCVPVPFPKGLQIGRKADSEENSGGPVQIPYACERCDFCTMCEEDYQEHAKKKHDSALPKMHRNKPIVIQPLNVEHPESVGSGLSTNQMVPSGLMSTGGITMSKLAQSNDYVIKLTIPSNLAKTSPKAKSLLPNTLYGGSTQKGKTNDNNSVDPKPFIYGTVNRPDGLVTKVVFPNPEVQTPSSSGKNSANKISKISMETTDVAHWKRTASGQKAKTQNQNIVEVEITTQQALKGGYKLEDTNDEPMNLVKDKDPHISRSPAPGMEPEKQIIRRPPPSGRKEPSRRLRPWLIEKLDNDLIKGLHWIDKRRLMFKMTWFHGGNSNWSPDSAQLFKEWARHTGRFREGIDKEEWAKWKTRIRCAFNKSPDIVEIKEMTKLDADVPFKVFRFIQQHQLNSKIYGCTMCSDTFPTAVDRDQHRQKAHIDCHCSECKKNGGGGHKKHEKHGVNTPRESEKEGNSATLDDDCWELVVDDGDNSEDEPMDVIRHECSQCEYSSEDFNEFAKHIKMHAFENNSEESLDSEPDIMVYNPDVEEEATNDVNSEEQTFVCHKCGFVSRGECQQWRHNMTHREISADKEEQSASNDAKSDHLEDLNDAKCVKGEKELTEKETDGNDAIVDLMTSGKVDECTQSGDKQISQSCPTMVSMLGKQSVPYDKSHGKQSIAYPGSSTTDISQTVETSENVEISQNQVVEIAPNKTGEPDTHTCQFCGKFYKSLHYLEIHVQGHLDKISLLCDECGSGFEEEPELIRHKLKHAIEKSNTKTSPRRRAKGRRSSDLEVKKVNQRKSGRHSLDSKIDTIDGDKAEVEEPQTCAKCGIKSRNSTEHRKHLKVHRNLECTLNDSVTAPKRRRLAYNIKDEDFKFSCHECDAKFNEFDAFIKHANVHLSKSDTCGRCGKDLGEKLGDGGEEEKEEGIEELCPDCENEKMAAESQSGQEEEVAAETESEEFLKSGSQNDNSSGGSDNVELLDTSSDSATESVVANRKNCENITGRSKSQSENKSSSNQVTPSVSENGADSANEPEIITANCEKLNGQQCHKEYSYRVVSKDLGNLME